MKMDAVGFTGTQNGMTAKQSELLMVKLRDLRQQGFKSFHHGDCVGADDQADQISTLRNRRNSGFTSDSGYERTK